MAVVGLGDWKSFMEGFHVIQLNNKACLSSHTCPRHTFLPFPCLHSALHTRNLGTQVLTLETQQNTHTPLPGRNLAPANRSQTVDTDLIDMGDDEEGESSGADLPAGQAVAPSGQAVASQGQAIAVVVDAEATSYLMMGALSPGGTWMNHQLIGIVDEDLV